MTQPIYVGNRPVPALKEHRIVQGGWAWGIAELVAGATVVRLATKPGLNWEGARGDAKLKVEQEHYPLTSKWIPLAAGLYLMFGGFSVLAKKVAYVVPNGTAETGGCGCSSNAPKI